MGVAQNLTGPIFENAVEFFTFCQNYYVFEIYIYFSQLHLF
jgi:hypothetical protein